MGNSCCKPPLRLHVALTVLVVTNVVSVVSVVSVAHAAKDRKKMMSMILEEVVLLAQFTSSV